MKKLTVVFAMLAVFSFLVVGNAMAIPVGTALQGVFDGVTVGGDSSVDVATDYIADEYDSYWRVTASGFSGATMIVELAGFANNNIFGVYNDGQYVQLFAGSNVQGDQVALSIKADGSVYVNFADTGVDFASYDFGYYLDSSMNNGGVLAHSDTSLNDDGYDHMLAYQGTGTDMLQLPGLAPGTWSDNEFILAFEDLYGGGDQDFTDFVLMVESVEPVPEPATILLFGAGLLGLAAYGRKKGFRQS